MEVKQKPIDLKRYRQLLAKVLPLPRPRKSDEECDRLLAVIEPMMNKELSPEEDALCKLAIQKLRDVRPVRKRTSKVREWNARSGSGELAPKNGNCTLRLITIHLRKCEVVGISLKSLDLPVYVGGGSGLMGGQRVRNRRSNHPGLVLTRQQRTQPCRLAARVAETQQTTPFSRFPISGDGRVHGHSIEHRLSCDAQGKTFGSP